MSEHSFDHDVCTRCGAQFGDALQGPIGCEAEDAANPDGYLGLALTGTEQRAGITTEDKVAWIHGKSQAGTPFDAGLRRWNEEVERDADALAAAARRALEELQSGRD